MIPKLDNLLTFQRTNQKIGNFITTLVLEFTNQLNNDRISILSLYVKVEDDDVYGECERDFSRGRKRGSEEMKRRNRRGKVEWRKPPWD